VSWPRLLDSWLNGVEMPLVVETLQPLDRRDRNPFKNPFTTSRRDLPDLGVTWESAGHMGCTGDGSYLLEQRSGLAVKRIGGSSPLASTHEVETDLSTPVQNCAVIAGRKLRDQCGSRTTTSCPRSFRR